jgi:hypothetical protein
MLMLAASPKISSEPAPEEIELDAPGEGQPLARAFNLNARDGRPIA